MANDPVDEILGKEKEPEAEPEPKEPAPEIEPEGKKEPQKEAPTVPLAALHEARAQTRELRDRISGMEALFKRFQEEKAGETKREPPIPAFDEDPASHLLSRLDTMQKALESVQEDGRRRGEGEKTRAGEMELLEKYAASSRAFSLKNPDFQEAYEHLAKSVDAELQARGYDDPVERSQLIQYEEGILVGRAMKMGKDPAEVIYNLARHRGYKPGEIGEAEESKLERISKGSRAAKSLSSTGAKGEGSMTLQRLSELAESDPDTFDREWEKARRTGMLG